jgi:hypothetical protein
MRAKDKVRLEIVQTLVEGDSSNWHVALRSSLVALLSASPGEVKGSSRNQVFFRTFKGRFNTGIAQQTRGFHPNKKQLTHASSMQSNP